MPQFIRYRIFLIFLFMLVLSILPHSIAQDRNARDEGTALLRQAAEKLGGLEAFSQIRNLTFRGNAFVYEGTGSTQVLIETIAVLPDQYKTTISYLGDKASEVLDKDHVFLIAPDGKTQNLSRNDQKRLRLQLWVYPAFLLARVASSNVIAEFMGNSTIDDRAVKVIRVQPSNDLPSFNVYLDDQTLEPFHIVFSIPTDRGVQNAVWILSDYRKVSEIRLPHKITWYTSQTKLQETTFQSLIVNDVIDEKLFKTYE